MTASHYPNLSRRLSKQFKYQKVEHGRPPWNNLTFILKTAREDCVDIGNV